MRRAVAALLSATLASAASTPSCLDVLSSSTSFTGACSDAWYDLQTVIKPTQPQVGYAWIGCKLKDFTDESTAQATMDEDATPVVIGTTDDGTLALYAVDDHHTLCSLDYSGYSSVTVTVNVLCDLRSLSTADFWATLAANNFTFLAAHPEGEPNALPVPITPAEMPTSFTFNSKTRSLSDDPWRSLAGYSRKVKEAPSPAPACGDNDDKFCMRCFFRGCGNGGDSDSGSSIPFFEFRWGYYMLTAYDSASWWPSKADYSAFVSAYDALPQGDLPDEVDTTAWLDAAALLVPLCRGSATGGFVPPASLFPGSNGLPGYTYGYTPLAADPTCDAPVCAAGF